MKGQREFGQRMAGTSRASIGNWFEAALPRLAVGTTALTFALVLLGVWTAVAGYGLTCDGRWPLCDGAVFGLFPANFGSFVEWFHRLVAMVTGFAILGSAAGTWIAGSSLRARAAFTAALVLTPVQVVLGGLTVTRYEQLILASHFGAAVVILALLVVGTLLLLDRPVSAVLFGSVAAGSLFVAAALTPGVLVAVHSVGLHVGFVGLALAGFVALLGVAVSPGSRPIGLRALAGTGALFVAVATTIGRVRLDPSGQILVLAGLSLALVLAVVIVASARRGSFDADRIGPAEF